MNRSRFISLRQDRWQRLETLAGRAGHAGPRSLSANELLELGALYRSAASDLAVARRDYTGHDVTEYLNGLVARTHALVYRERRVDVARVGRFVRYGFPQAYRSIGRYTLCAFALFALSALIAYVLVALDDSLADVLLPGTAQPLRHIMEQHHLWVNTPGESDSVVANYIMLNNIQVAFLAFAGGILLGTLTAYVMISNGIMLGAIGALVAHHGLSGPFWSFVIGHGVVELSVIFMAGGAGLSVGDAVLRPGLRVRREALAAASRTAVRVVFGCVPLLVIAGTIEGFLSPSGAPAAVKIGVGLITGTLLYGYLFLSRPNIAAPQYSFEDVFDQLEAAQRRDLAFTSR